MKKLMLFALVAIGVYACNNTKPTAPQANTFFTYEVVKDADFAHLPALQSFVFGTADSGKYWLIFGGRTNGFHGFGSQTDFPFKKANKFIYVYNTTTHTLDSVSVDYLQKDLREQYTSSNMENRQIDSFLYVCGGYGEVHHNKPDSQWITHKILSRVNINQMVTAVLNKDSNALRNAIVYDTSSFVRATGGELYKLADGKFYLVVGHDFHGQYGNTDSTSPLFPVQTYLDAVHVFKLNETSQSIKIDTTSFQTITDGLPDATTQFRRRDLNVVPSVINNGTAYGITIYGGVFTPAGNPFRQPIYITGGNTPGYTIDANYFQKSNIYSAPNFVMYDSLNNQMLTTIFGGLGDTLASNIGPSKNLPNGPDSAAFTKFILNINRNYNTGQTSYSYNPIFKMPDYVGAEGLFIPSTNLPQYNNNNLGIVDYNKVPLGQNLLGYIYGGILSDSTQWNNKAGVVPGSPSNVTHPSNAVYKVYMTKAFITK